MRFWVLHTLLCTASGISIADVRNELCEVGFRHYLPPFVRRMVPCPYEHLVTEQTFTKHQISTSLTHDLPVLNAWIRDKAPDLYECIV